MNTERWTQRIIHGYRPTNIKCPSCGNRHGMMESTDVDNVFRYRCWCGTTAKCTLEDHEYFDADGVLQTRAFP